MRRYTISEIAEALGAEAVGEMGLAVRGAAEPGTAGPGDLALAMDPKYAEALSRGAARAALVWPGADWRALGLEAAIFAPRGRMALAGVTRLMDPGPGIAPGVHPTAVLGAGADLDEGAAVGPHVVIGDGVRIGRGARIAAQVTIGDGTAIGADAMIHAGARIGPRVTVGDRWLCQPNAVVGADGFSYVTPETSRAEAARAAMGATDAAAQRWVRIHSLGGVEIGDDVEIGACACVDAGTIRPTRIGSGTKIDNLVHIAHNCEIGRDCLFAGQVGIAGSVTVGDGVILGGKVGVVDNIFIGAGVVAGGATVIMSNVPAGRVILGYPAVKMETHVEMYKALRRLPRLLRDLAAQKKPVSKPGESD